MRLTLTLFAIILICSCNDADPKKETAVTQKDSSKTGAETPKEIVTEMTDTRDSSSVIKMADEIMKAAAAKDYQKFATYMHPEKGTQLGEKVCSATELMQMVKSKKKFDFGTGYSEPEMLTVGDFFTYEFIDLEQKKGVSKLFNKLHRGPDASTGIMRGLSPSHDIVEYFFQSGSNELDWGATRLYFEWKENAPYLVSVEYDHWTP